MLRMSVSKRGGRWQASLTVERADLPIPSPPKAERRHRLGREGTRHIVGRHRDTQPARTQIEPQTVEESPTESEPQTERLQPPPQGESAGRPTIRTGGEPAFGRPAQQDHRHARPYLRGHQHRGLERGGHGENHGLARSIQNAAFAGVPTPTDLQDRTRRREASRHRPLVSKLEDLLELRDGEGWLPLSERVYHCGKCGLSIDRDERAINIQVAGSALRRQTCVEEA